MSNVTYTEQNAPEINLESISLSFPIFQGNFGRIYIWDLKSCISHVDSEQVLT